jgi:hypothetical protein
MDTNSKQRRIGRKEAQMTQKGNSQDKSRRIGAEARTSIIGAIRTISEFNRLF